MATFETELAWSDGKQAILNARDNPILRVAAPPEFGGPPGIWCPEELLAASVESCLMSTFLYFAERFSLALAGYSSRAKAVLEKTAAGLRFSGVEVRINVVWADAESLEKAGSLELKEKLAKYCPVSASLNCPLSVQMEFRKPASDNTNDRGNAI